MTPPSKERLPTPRECRETIGDLEWSGTWEESDTNCCPVCQRRPINHEYGCKLDAFLKRLTDEALELDEKRVAQDSRRRAALEVWFNVRKDLEKADAERMKLADAADWNDKEEFNAIGAADEKVQKMIKLEEKAFFDLDALTPDPKEGQK